MSIPISMNDSFLLQKGKKNSPMFTRKKGIFSLSRVAPILWYFTFQSKLLPHPRVTTFVEIFRHVSQDQHPSRPHDTSPRGPNQYPRNPPSVPSHGLAPDSGPR